MVKKMEAILNFDCIVIGAGPAGLTASIYLKRANLNVLVIEKGIPGGQMNFASSIENYPGFISIEGIDLASKMYEQAKELDISFKMAEVKGIKTEFNYKTIILNNEEITCKYIIIATGRQQKKLNIPGEEQLVGKGISYCALCDGMFFKNKNVVVIGGGNSAIEETIQLAKIVKHVTIIHRRDEFKAEAILIDKMLKLDNVSILYNTIVTKFIEENGILSGVSIENNLDKTKSILNIEGAFIYIGYEPDIKIVDGLDIKNSNGYLVVNDKNETNIEGIYACGDSTSKEVYQIVTAIGDGALAATNIIRNFK